MFRIDGSRQTLTCSSKLLVVQKDTRSPPVTLENRANSGVMVENEGQCEILYSQLIRDRCNVAVVPPAYA